MIQHLIKNQLQFNTWANQAIINWMRSQETELLYKEIPSSFKSLAATLEHMLRVQKFWHQFILQNDITNFVWEPINGNIIESMHEMETQSMSMQNSSSDFSESELSEPLNLQMPWASGTAMRYEYILHVVNHSTFHRGQIISMARILGADQLPPTDLNKFNLKFREIQ